jgi:hypothetical protein
MENNTTPTTTTGGGFWSNLGSVLTNKAVDLADSYAALKLGSKYAPKPAEPAPSSSDLASNQNTKKWIIIGGVAAAVVVVVALLFRRRR